MFDEQIIILKTFRDSFSMNLNDSNHSKPLASSINAGQYFGHSMQQQQSQYLNRQLLSLIQASIEKKTFKQEQSKNSFSEKQLLQSDLVTSMRINFRRCCPNSQGIMDYVHFRKMLGLLGREDSFISRIFHLIDQNNNGLISAQEYCKYMMRTLFGSQDEKAYNAWCILIGKRRGQYSKRDLGLQLYDFMEIFDELAQLWNSLTQQVIPVNKKYVQELFNIFDLDQDQVITFSDYRIFHHQQPSLFGWFQYLNGINIDQKKAAGELVKLREKLNQGKRNNQMSLEQVKDRLNNKKSIVQNGLKGMFEKLSDTKNISVRQSMKYIELSKMQNSLQQKQSNYEFEKSKSIKVNSKRYQTSMNISQLNNASTNLYLDSSYTKPQKYVYSKLLKDMKTNHIQDIQSHQSRSQMSKIHDRKTQQLKQGKTQIKNQLVRELKGFLNSTDTLIKRCQQYRQLLDLSKQFSPTKLRERKAKFTVVNSTALKAFQKKNCFDQSKPLKRTLFDQQRQGCSEQQQRPKTPSLIYFSHPNWNLVLNLMVGMRKSIKALFDIRSVKKQKQIHFNEVHQFLLGNKVTHGQFFSEYFKFVQIAPAAFQRLRKSFGLQNIQYQRSVGPQMLLNHLLTGNLTTLNQKCSAGKSGSFFYLTLDNKVFLKTIPKRQYDSFMNILKQYYKHMIKNQNSLMVRIYGLYKLKVFVGKQKKQTIYFISMENIFKDLANLNKIFQTKQGFKYQIRIKQVYDLKGSFYKRTGEQGKQMKDNNWIDKKMQLHFQKNEQEKFIQQIKLDTKFLKVKNLIDYSLLTAIVEIFTLDQNVKIDWRKIQNQVSSNSNIFKRFHGGILGTQENSFYIISIIDYLTVFETAKNFQYVFKTTFLSKDVSCVPPKKYCQRFRTFISDKVIWESQVPEDQAHQQQS